MAFVTPPAPAPPTTPPPSPTMHSMPAEILSLVFISSLPEFPSRTSTKDAPLVLSSVCRCWREVALATPQLWASIGVFITGNNVGALERVFREWTGRSGRCPLALSVTSSLPWSSCRDVLDVILLNSQRLEDLYLQIPGDGTESILEEVRGEKVSPLRTLILETNQYQNFRPVEVDLSYFPWITYLSVRGVRELNLSLSNTKWHDLMEVNLRSPISAISCLCLIPLCPKLTAFSAHVVCRPNSRTLLLPNLIITHSALESLSLHMDIDDCPFIEHLSLPRLKYFSLRGLYSEVVNDNTRWISLIAFFARSKTQLRTLDIRPPMGANSLLDCLRQTPQLRVLRVHGILAHDVLSTFTAPSKPCLPLMRDLKIYDRNYLRAGSSSDMLISLISSRWDGGYGALRSVKLRHSLRNPVCLNKEIKRCIDEGLELYIY